MMKLLVPYNIDNGYTPHLEHGIQGVSHAYS
jgi:hypothetical protein